MKIKQDTTIVSAAGGTGKRRATPKTHQNWITSSRTKQLVKRLPDTAPCVVARAPGRLNVMGGIAEYTGSLVLNLPAQDVVAIALQPRKSSEISLRLDDRDDFVVPVSPLLDDLQNATPARLKQSFTWGDDDRLNRCVLGVIVELLRAKLIPELTTGLTIAIDRVHPGVFGHAEYISITSALMVAMASLFDRELEIHNAIKISQNVQSDWLESPAANTDAMCCLRGEPFVLGGLRSDSYTQEGSVTMNDGIRFVGIDCGVTHDHQQEKYNRVRVASFMGRMLIDRIVNHDHVKDMQWNGNMSCVSVTDFVERFRDRIPTKMNGGDFLDRFGDTGDPHTTVEPDTIYKIRSRTEHHIYEHTRCRQLVECLSRWSRCKDPAALVDAEAAMYASHWSYGQRCGLGSIETDLLVNLIRRHGADVEIHGAKISGHGCGGMVTVLMQPTDQALSALENAIKDYVDQTGLQTTLVNDSSPGAMITGAHHLVL